MSDDCEFDNVVSENDYEDDDSEVEDFRTAVASKLENDWFLKHYTELEELYSSFKTNGETIFGGWFFQSGGFHHFVHFVYLHSQLSSKPP